MSCISKILEVKGDKPVLIDGEIAIEGGGVFKGFEYIITFTSHGHRCGYVAVPESHPLHECKEDYPDYEVHGGITFFGNSRFGDLTGGHSCSDKWIGFDACHWNDTEDMERAEKYFGETEWVKYRKDHSFKLRSETGIHRTFAYMKNECRLLIHQLIKQEVSYAA